MPTRLPQTTDPQSAEIANAAARYRIVEKTDSTITLKIPGTDYQLQLDIDSPIDTPVGKHVSGEVHTTALRMHQSDTGGQFIEPVYGRPRIVQGLVQALDPANHRVLFQMMVPVWVTLKESQSIDDFKPGAMWNSYVESGTKFIVN